MAKISWSLIGLTASLLSGTALAQTGSGFDDLLDGASSYLSLKVGANWPAHNTRFVTTNRYPDEPINGTGSYEDGYAITGAGGLSWANGLRIELEGAQRYNQSDKFFLYGKGTGSMRNYTVMANAYYDIPPELLNQPADFPIRSYVGFGLGGSDYTPFHIRGATMPYPLYIGGPDSWGFGYQFMVGTGYKVNDNIMLTIEYRYLGRSGDNPPGISTSYEAHSALVGFRYTFGEPPAPPAPAPAVYVPPPAPPPPAPRSYLVFFNFNKSDLTAEARGIVDQAASNAKVRNITRLDVTGYTDTVGSDAYNMRLSRRRAESVSAELQSQGVPASDIEIFAKGKHDLLVPTRDGVREPRNRRVQIVYEGGTS